MNFPSKYKNDSSKSTGLLFIKAYNNWHTEIKKQLKRLEITHPQYVVLTVLGYLEQFHDEVTQVMIAEMSEMDVMTTSQVLKLLEKKEFVERKQHSVDTRAKAIKLKKKGQDVLQKAVPLVEKIDHLFFGTLEEKEADFQKFLQRLSKYKLAEK